VANVNLALSLLFAAERNPEAEAVVEGAVRITYAQLRQRAARLAGGLAYCKEDSRATLVLKADVDLESMLGDEHPGALDASDEVESLMLYTSGTTGRPKSVPRSHRPDRARKASPTAYCVRATTSGRASRPSARSARQSFEGTDCRFSARPFVVATVSYKHMTLPTKA
jgi:acyl-coenzyme A synthetase/AMP-(fatty) acid ligase